MNRFSLLASLVVALVSIGPAIAADPAAVQHSIAKATAFLVSSQADDGSFAADIGPAMTGLVLTALVRSGTPPDAPVVQR